MSEMDEMISEKNVRLLESPGSWKTWATPTAAALKSAVDAAQHECAQPCEDCAAATQPTQAKERMGESQSR